MREHPIILNEDMVRAVLTGSKTQARQPVKPVKGYEHDNICRPDLAIAAHKVWWHGEFENVGVLQSCPLGQPGDRLWVREKFAAFDADWCFPGRPHDLRDGPWPNFIYPANGGKEPPKGTCRPSVNMPRWASRITLEITGVRVERLQDISHRDACREGLFREEYNWRENEFPLDDIAYRTSPTAKTRFSCPKQCFQELWESIYKPESWQANPWVWVIEFKRVEGE